MFFIVGEPIEVKKVENPSNQQIDELHGIFVKQLTELFETHKHNYLEEAEKFIFEVI